MPGSRLLSNEGENVGPLSATHIALHSFEPHTNESGLVNPQQATCYYRPRPHKLLQCGVLVCPDGHFLLLTKVHTASASLP